jgi:hypothetical protein
MRVHAVVPMVTVYLVHATPYEALLPPPLMSEYGTYTTVKARFRPWLSGEKAETDCSERPYVAECWRWVQAVLPMVTAYLAHALPHVALRPAHRAIIARIFRVKNKSLF